MTNKEVAAAFAAGGHEGRTGRNDKNTYHFEDNRLYSYRELIAVILRRDIAWVNTSRYSNTTTRHQSLARMALQAQGLYVLETETLPPNRLPTLNKLLRDQEARELLEDAERKVRWAKSEERRANKAKLENLERLGRMQAEMTHEDIPAFTEPQSDTDTGFSTTPADRLKTANVTMIEQSDLRKCPFAIFVPEHYRPDGSCKCDDAEHRKKMIHDWDYTEESFKGIPLRSK